MLEKFENLCQDLDLFKGIAKIEQFQHKFKQKREK